MTAPNDKKPVVQKEDDVWVIRLEQDNGRVQEYRCASEQQAKQLAAVLVTKPG
jgi:hypothetical protein